jgi:hypothetical protein
VLIIAQATTFSFHTSFYYKLLSFPFGHGFGPRAAAGTLSFKQERTQAQAKFFTMNGRRPE